MMFGDNENVVNLSTLPHTRLHKRHNVLAFHKTRECVAAKVIRYVHMAGEDNPADIFSKHWIIDSSSSQRRLLGARRYSSYALVLREARRKVIHTHTDTQNLVDTNLPVEGYSRIEHQSFVQCFAILNDTLIVIIFANKSNDPSRSMCRVAK